MGLTRVAFTLTAIALYLASAVTALYTLVYLWSSVQSPTQSNLLMMSGLLVATVACLGVGRVLSQRGGQFTGYGAGGIGKTQGPR